VQSLQRALELESERRIGKAIPCTVRYPFSVFYRLQAHFDIQVQRFLDAFERRRIHFVLLEDLAGDSIHTLNDVFAFLEVSKIAASLNLEPKNIGGTFLAFSGLSPEWATVVRAEMAPVVARLEQQTGMSLRQRWGYLN
jgi:hypothetical protein